MDYIREERRRQISRPPDLELLWISGLGWQAPVKPAALLVMRHPYRSYTSYEQHCETALQCLGVWSGNWIFHLLNLPREPAAFAILRYEGLRSQEQLHEALHSHLGLPLPPALPKTELNLHLDGSLPFDFIVKRAVARGVAYPSNPLLLRRMVDEMKAAMRAIAPAAFQLRESKALRRAVRGDLILSFEGEVWQTDLDCKLQNYGLFEGAVIDVATRYLFNLVVLTDKLAATVWTHVIEPPMRAQGMPLLITTDKGSECKVTAFAARLCHHAANSGSDGHAYVPSKRNTRIERCSRAFVRTRDLCRALR